MTLSAIVALIVYSLAISRVTGLITSDSLTESARDQLIAWLDDRPKTLGNLIATLITCPWCAGMWVSLVAAPLVWFFGTSPVMLVPALALAFSQVTGMIAHIGRG